MGENDNFSEEQFWTKLREYLEEGGRETAPVETAPAPSARIGMFMPSSAPELRGRKNLAMFLERFYTWASVTRCESALDSEVAIKTSGTPRAELERLYNRALVTNSLQVWQSLTKALAKEPEIMKIVMEIGSPSEAWRALSKIAAETEGDAYDRTKRTFETLEMTANETVSEYFARVNIVLMKLEKHDITMSARKIRRVILNSLTPRFPNETSMLAMEGDFNLSELEHGLARVEKLRSDSSRSAPSHVLAVSPCGRRPNRDWRWSPWTRPAGQALRRAPRRWSGPPSARTSATDAPWAAAPAPTAMSQQSYAWQQQQQQQQQYQPQFSQGLHHQQPNPWSSWGRPPHQSPGLRPTQHIVC